MQDENDIRHATLSRPKPVGEAKPKKEEKPKRRAVAGGDLYSMVLNQGNASAELIDSERARRQRAPAPCGGMGQGTLSKNTIFQS